VVAVLLNQVLLTKTPKAAPAHDAAAE